MKAIRLTHADSKMPILLNSDNIASVSVNPQSPNGYSLICYGDSWQITVEESVDEIQKQLEGTNDQA